MDGLIVATAGWSIPREVADRFKPDGSALERYAAVFSGVEVNSSFYRRHRLSTWQRWHDSTPPEFRFAVKLPKAITHERALEDSREELAIFAGDIAPLGGKLGPVLVQLPPSLAFEAGRDARFFAALRERIAGPVVLEPRHDSWAGPEASLLLASFRVDRVAADPQSAVLREAALAGGTGYCRLHGAPKIYYSAYSRDDLKTWRQRLALASGRAWCVFDNTASGAAARNALELQAMLADPVP